MTPEEIHSIEVAEDVLARVAKGVPPGREIMANETIHVLRALVIWKRAAEAGARYIEDAQERALS